MRVGGGGGNTEVMEGEVEDEIETAGVMGREEAVGVYEKVGDSVGAREVRRVAIDSWEGRTRDARGFDSADFFRRR